MVHTTKVVTMIAVGVGLLFFVLAVALAGVTLAESCIFALGMIVAFVPEGLLPTVTLALAMGTQRMARRHALIKRLSAVETLGCTTVICTDKTGTLTQNEMTVCELWLAGRQLTVTGVGYAPEGQLLEHGQPIAPACGRRCASAPRGRWLVQRCPRYCPPMRVDTPWTILGDPTEAALRVVASKGGIDVEAEAQQMPRLRELPFDSRRKRMSTIHQPCGTPHATPIAYVKGAPKEVLALCTRILLHGHVCPLEESHRAQIIAANDADRTPWPARARRGPTHTPSRGDNVHP